MVPINNSVLIRRQGVARFDAQHAIVQPETVIKWYRQGFKLYWRWKSRAGKRGRPCILGEIRDLRGRDGIYGNCFKARVKSMGIDEVVIAPRSPWQNPYCERVIGWIGLTAPIRWSRCPRPNRSQETSRNSLALRPLLPSAPHRRYYCEERRRER